MSMLINGGAPASSSGIVLPTINHTTNLEDVGIKYSTESNFTLSSHDIFWIDFQDPVQNTMTRLVIDNVYFSCDFPCETIVGINAGNLGSSETFNNIEVISVTPNCMKWPVSENPLILLDYGRTGRPDLNMNYELYLNFSLLHPDYRVIGSYLTLFYMIYDIPVN